MKRIRRKQCLCMSLDCGTLGESAPIKLSQRLQDLSIQDDIIKAIKTSVNDSNLAKHSSLKLFFSSTFSTLFFVCLST